MTTGNILPEGDITTEWNVIGSGTYHYERIDETTPIITDGIMAQGSAYANKTDQFDMGLQDIKDGVITQVDVKLYHTSLWSLGSGDIGYVNLYIDGSWQGQKTISEQASTAWETFTWSGLSVRQQAWGDIEVKVTSGNLQTSSNCVTVHDHIYLYSMYATITYYPIYAEILGHDCADINYVIGEGIGSIDELFGA